MPVGSKMHQVGMYICMCLGLQISTPGIQPGHHPLSIPWRIITSRPKARRRNQNPPRHTSPFQKCRILLMLTLLVPMPISFQNWAQAVPSHGQQLPNLSLSCQTASLVKQLLLLILQYHTLPIYPSRALCKFKVLCFTNLNEAQFGRGTNLFFSGSIGSISIFLLTQLNPHLRLVLLFQSHHSRAFEVEASCYEALKHTARYDAQQIPLQHSVSHVPKDMGDRILLIYVYHI